VWSTDRRFQEPGTHLEEELLQASDRAGRVAEPSEEAADGQVEEEELHTLDRCVAQRHRQAAAADEQPRLHDATRSVQQQPARGALRAVQSQSE